MDLISKKIKLLQRLANNGNQEAKNLIEKLKAVKDDYTFFYTVNLIIPRYKKEQVENLALKEDVKNTFSISEEKSREFMELIDQRSKNRGYEVFVEIIINASINGEDVDSFFAYRKREIIDDVDTVSILVNSTINNLYFIHSFQKEDFSKYSLNKEFVYTFNYNESLSDFLEILNKSRKNDRYDITSNVVKVKDSKIIKTKNIIKEDYNEFYYAKLDNQKRVVNIYEPDKINPFNSSLKKYIKDISYKDLTDYTRKQLDLPNAKEKYGVLKESKGELKEGVKDSIVKIIPIGQKLNIYLQQEFSKTYENIYAKGGDVGDEFAKGGTVRKKTKGDIGKSGTQYGYTLKEWEQMAKKKGLLVSPREWWKSQEGKPYTDSFGRKKAIGQHSGDKQHSMGMYGYLIANGLDLGSKIIPTSAKKYVEENNYAKYELGGGVGDLYLSFDKIMADGGGVGKSKSFFDKDELINLIKTYDFKSVDVSNMETISYSKSENPFDKFDVGTIKLSPLVRDYNDSLLIVIDKQKGKYIIRIGADTGWTGGLEQSSVELTFDIPKLTFEEFKKGFLNATINQNYCLVSKYGTGNIDTIHFQGNLQEIKDYALENGYELKESNGIFDFYFYKKDLPSWRKGWDGNDKLLQVYVLSSQQIDNITERNEGSRYAKGGGVGEIKFEELVGNKFSIERGSGTKTKNWSKEDLLEEIKGVIKHELFDRDFYYNWTDEGKEYSNIFDKYTLNPMLKDIDKTLNEYFVMKKYPNNQTLEFIKGHSEHSQEYIDNWFKTNPHISPTLRNDYKKYREKYAGVTPYAKGGGVGKLNTLQKRVYESVKNRSSKSITTNNLPNDTRKILEELYYMDLLNRSYIKDTQEAEYTLKYAKGGGVGKRKVYIGEVLGTYFVYFLERKKGQHYSAGQFNKFEWSLNKVKKWIKDEGYELVENPNKNESGGDIEGITLTTEQVENKLGRKLHWWNDDVVSINGIEYKKVFLKNEYIIK